MVLVFALVLVLVPILARALVFVVVLVLVLVLVLIELLVRVRVRILVLVLVLVIVLVLDPVLVLVPITSALAIRHSIPHEGDAVQQLVAALRSSRWAARAPRRAVPIGKLTNLVDPASSHMLVSKIKPCMSQYKPLHDETANGSLKQL